MAFITAETRSSIVELAMGMLNQAPSTAMLETLIAKSVEGASTQDLADYIATTAAFTAEYPATQTAREFATEMFGKLITGGTLDAEINTAVIDLLEGLLTGGTTKAQGFVAVIDFLANPANAAHADLGDIAQSFQNRADAAEYFSITKELGGSTDAELAAAIASVTSDAATLTAANAASDSTASAGTVVAGQTFTLTTGLDTGSSFTGGTGDDTFNATAATVAGATVQTLNAGDSLDGGEGADTLTIANTSATAGFGAGVSTKSIESISINGVTATDVDAALMAGLNNVQNNASLSDISVTGFKAIPTVSLLATNKNTTIGVAATATAGNEDAMSVTLSGASTATASAITANGIEIFNVTAEGSTSGSLLTGKTVSLVSDALREVNIEGAASAALNVNLVGASATIAGVVKGGDASNSVSITAASTDKLDVDLGAGNDILAIANISALHELEGGDGVDTLIYSGANTVTPVLNKNLTGFEGVILSNATPGSFALADTASVNYSNSASGTFTGLKSGGTLTLSKGGTATLAETYSATSATAAVYAGADDSMTVNVGTATTTGALGAATVVQAGIESITINNISAANNENARTVGIVDGVPTTGATKSLTVTGGAATTVTASGTASLTTVDLSGLSAGATFTGTVSKAGAEITGGAGNDTLSGGAGADTISAGDGDDVVSGGAGDDTINAGDGINTITGGSGKDTMSGGDGADTYVFASNATTASTPVVTSIASAADTITNFVSGTDKISVTGTHAPQAFLGNFPNIQTALSAQGKAGTLAYSAAFVESENSLYVFKNTNGTLDADDMVIKLTDVTELKAADLLLGSQGTGAKVTLTAAGASTTQSGATSGTEVDGIASVKANMTTGDDTVTSTVANIIGSTVTAGAGVDTLALSITKTAATGAEGTLTAANIGAITGIDEITLADFKNSATIENDYDITLADVNIADNSTLKITSSQGGLKADGTLLTAGVTIDASNLTGNRVINFAGGTAQDDVKGGAGNDILNGGAGNDTLKGNGGDDTLQGGDGDDTLDGDTGTNKLYGGAGNDKLQATESIATADKAVLDGGDGLDDELYVSAGKDLDLTNSTLKGVEEIIGSSGNEVVTLTHSQLDKVLRIDLDGDAGDVIELQNDANDTDAKTFDLTGKTVAGQDFLLLTAGSTLKANAAQIDQEADGTGIAGGDTLAIADDSAFTATSVEKFQTITATAQVDKNLTIAQANLTKGTDGAAATTGASTITGSGTSNLVIVSGAASTYMTFTDVTGFDKIDFQGTNNTGQDLFVDVADLVSVKSIVDSSTANAGHDLLISDSGVLNTELVLDSDFNEITFDTADTAAATTLTVPSGAVSGLTMVVKGTNGGAKADDKLVINAATATSAIDIGALTATAAIADVTVNGGTGNNVVTVVIGATTNIMTIDLSQGGNDQVTIKNTTAVANNAATTATNDVTIKGFTSGIGAGSDVVDVLINNGATQTVNYQTVGAAGALTAVSTVVEIESAVGTVADFTAVADGLAVETLIANALVGGTGGAGKIAVIIYGSGTNAGNAALYEVSVANVAANADIVTGDLSAVNLLGVFEGVTADSIVSGNII